MILRNKCSEDIILVLKSFTQLNSFQGAFNDVLLVCEDEEMAASRIILALAFPEFKEVLKHRDDDDLTVILPNCRTEEVKQNIIALFNVQEVTKHPNVTDRVISNDTKSNHSGQNLPEDNYLPEIKQEVNIYKNINDQIKKPNEIDSFDKENQEFPCSYCNRTFYRHQEINKHYRREHLEMVNIEPTKYAKTKCMFHCGFCPLRFVRRQELNVHLGSDHKNTSKILPFNVDSEGLMENEPKGEFKNILIKFTNILQQLKIDKFQSLDRFGYFSCTECDFKSSEWKLLDEHIIDLHDGIYKRQDAKTQLLELLNTMKTFELVPKEFGNGWNWNENTAEKAAKMCSFIKVKHCQLCEFSNGRFDTMEEHVFSFHGIRRYECEKCAEKYYKLEFLKEHQTNEHDMWGGRVQCDHCDKMFSPKLFGSHMKSVKALKRQCPECKNFYANVGSHIKRFHRGKRRQANREGFISCKMCLKAIYKTDQESHSLVCVPYLQELTCGICHLSFKRGTPFNIHLRTMHLQEVFQSLNISDRLNSADPEVWEATGVLLTETKTEHDGQNTLCSFCGLSQKFKGSMINHMKQHCQFTFKKKTGDSELCPKCGKDIAKSRFTVHTEACNKDRKVKKVSRACKVCNKEFSRNRNLESHMKVHSKEKTFICTLCEKSFSHADGLNRHILTHGQLNV